MRGKLLLAAAAVIVVSAGLYSSGMLQADAYETHFGFPAASDLSLLMSGTYLQNCPAVFNTTSSGAFLAYGLYKTETAVFSTINNTTAENYVFITEFSFNSRSNASSFYDAQLFGNIAVQSYSPAAGSLNLSYRGAVYSVLTIQTSSNPLQLVLGHRQGYAFSVIVTDRAQFEQLVSLAELVIDSMS